MGWSADFLLAIRNQINNPHIVLTYDGVDYENEVISVSPITRNNTLSAGTVEVTVNNSAKTFNGRITDNTWDQQRAYVKIYFDGIADEMNLFAGIPFKVDYCGKNAVIYIRDNMAKMIDRPVGRPENPVSYLAGYNAATLVWLLLTDPNYGNLDATASAANTDIAYTNWAAWHTDCTDKQYTLCGYFTGQTIRDILLRVCELTDSYIWVNGDGLFEFAMNADGSQMTGSENYTVANIKISDKTPFLAIDIDQIVNDFLVYYDYDVKTDTYNSGAESVTDPDSIDCYGRHKDEERDTTIWHADANSCSSFRAAYISRHKDPHTIVSFDAFMASWLEEVSYTVSVTHPLLDINSMTMTITEMTILPKEGKTRMSLWWPWPHVV